MSIQSLTDLGLAASAMRWFFDKRLRCCVQQQIAKAQQFTQLAPDDQKILNNLWNLCILSDHNNDKIKPLITDFCFRHVVPENHEDYPSLFKIFGACPYNPQNTDDYKSELVRHHAEVIQREFIHICLGPQPTELIDEAIKVGASTTNRLNHPMALISNVTRRFPFSWSILQVHAKLDITVQKLLLNGWDPKSSFLKRNMVIPHINTALQNLSIASIELIINCVGNVHIFVFSEDHVYNDTIYSCAPEHIRTISLGEHIQAKKKPSFPAHINDGPIEQITWSLTNFRGQLQLLTYNGLQVANKHALRVLHFIDRDSTLHSSSDDTSCVEIYENARCIHVKVVETLATYFVKPFLMNNNFPDGPSSIICSYYSQTENLLAMPIYPSAIAQLCREEEQSLGASEKYLKSLNRMNDSSEKLRALCTSKAGIFASSAFDAVRARLAPKWDYVPTDTTQTDETPEICQIDDRFRFDPEPDNGVTILPGNDISVIPHDLYS